VGPQVAKHPVAIRSDGFREQPVQLVERHGCGVVLIEVLLDELGYRQRPARAVFSSQPLEQALKRSSAAPASCSVAKAARCMRFDPRPPAR
jgi:hypothetical protein